MVTGVFLLRSYYTLCNTTYTNQTVRLFNVGVTAAGRVLCYWLIDLISRGIRSTSALCVVGELLDANQLVEEGVVVRNDVRLVDRLSREFEHCLR